MAARAIDNLHDADKLTSDDKIVMLGLGPTVYHTILIRGDSILFDSIGIEEGNRFDFKKERYFYASVSGHLEVKAVIPIDDFFTAYVSKLNVAAPSAKDDPKLTN
jgi:hypothetical protein